jgi:predicted metal-dependent phosphoesterase TrpH
MIKVDLHLHTGEDPYDGLRYPATALIDRAVALGFAAIAVTLHGKVLDDPRIFAYARERGLLLIPACESRIQKVDVLLYNVTQREVDGIRSFAALRAFKRARGDDLLVIAPHPYYPVGHSLGRYLEAEMDLFDAIEQAQLHLPWLDYNRRARAVAARHGKPVVANSDAHNLWMFGRHYTWVEAGPTVPEIFAAIKAGRVQWHSPPVGVWDCVRMFVIEPLCVRKRGQTVNSFE